MVKKVLLTGASGTVGHEVLLELIRRDRYSIRILSPDRDYERKLFSKYQDKLEIVWGDIRNINDVEKAVNGSGVDFVIHMAGIIPPLADEKPYLAHDVNVGGTKNIIDAIGERNKPTKIIFTSSISVYGDRLINPYITVEDPLQPSLGDEYARSKIAAEEIIQKSNIHWSIFRLCGILTKKMKIQPLMFHMPLDTALEWCHPEDVGYALVEALEHRSLSKKIFNLGGGENCRIKAGDFLKKIFNIWGLDPGILPNYAFAIQNFHSGYYADSHHLNEILHFQKKNLQDYYIQLRNMVSPMQKVLLQLIPKSIIRKWLLNMSEPLKAIKVNNEELIERYYGSRKKFYEMITKTSL